MFTMYKYIILLLCGTCQSQWIQPLDIQSNSNSLCVPVGFDLVITCTRNLKQQSAAPEQKITIKKQFMDSNTAILPTIIKNGVEALLPNVTLNDTPVYCCLEDDCVGLNFIIGEPPSTPQDFKCVIYNLTKLECTWTSKDKCVTWSLHYETVPSFQNRYAHVNQTQTSCDGEGTPLFHECNPNNKCSELTKCIRNVWSLETTELDIVYKFRLTGSGNYGESTSYYNISTSYVILKLGDLSNCSSIYNGTSVEIGCAFPPGFPPAGFRYGLKCKIATQSIYGQHHDTIEYTDGDLQYLLEDTHPYTFYDVSLTCQVNKSLYWGNPFIYQFTTPQDVPLVGPTTSNQSYTTWCKAKKLYILIYIQPPNAKQTRGILTGYNMAIESTTDCWHRSFLPNKTTLFSSIDVNMCGSSVNYVVTIWSRTYKGDSKEATQLSVAANSTHMAITEVIVEETNSGYLVSWEGQAHPSKQCVYHWCISDGNSEGRTDDVICQENYNFSETIGRTLHISLNTDDRWKFGVSQNGTGIRWQDCVFLNGPPIRKPDRLKNESTIELPTSMAFCSKISQKGPRPLEYLVLYYDVTSNISECSTVNASMRTSFNGIPLKADTLYAVKYKIVYSKGRQSGFSDEVLFHTTKNLSSQVQQRVLISSGSSANVWKVAGGIMGAIAFLIIVLILMYTAIWRWKNIDDKIEDVSVQPPDVTESFKERYETITSKALDSGRGTLSTTKTSLNDNQLQTVKIQPTQGKPQNRLPLPYDIHGGSPTNYGHQVDSVDRSEQVPVVTSEEVDSTESEIQSGKVQFVNYMVGLERNQTTDYVRIDQFSIISSKI